LSEGFKAELTHLAPILTSVLFSVGCAYILMESQLGPYRVTPFPESPAGSFGNALYFVLLVGLGALVIFFLLKKKSYKLIAIITCSALVSVVFVLSMVYFYAFSTVFAPLPNEASVAVSAVITAAAGYVVLGTKSRLGDFLVLLLGGALGAFLGACIQTLSTALILCFLAVYDIFAVYRGLIGKIAHVGLEKLRGLSFSFGDIQMGLGDLTFYSMLVGHMLIYFGFLPCLASMAGVLLGYFLAFKQLERSGIFPGLPIPIFLGLAFGFLAALY
jgi:presenilin-like A22 family membrane protease